MASTWTEDKVGFEKGGWAGCFLVPSQFRVSFYDYLLTQMWTWTGSYPVAQQLKMFEPAAHVIPNRNDCKSCQIALCGSWANDDFRWTAGVLAPFLSLHLSPWFLARRHSPGEEAKGYPHLFNVPNPIPDVVEGLLIGNVVDQHDTLVGGERGTWALRVYRAGSVPIRTGYGHCWRGPLSRPANWLSSSLPTW